MPRYQPDCETRSSARFRPTAGGPGRGVRGRARLSARRAASRMPAHRRRSAARKERLLVGPGGRAGGAVLGPFRRRRAGHPTSELDAPAACGQGVADRLRRTACAGCSLRRTQPIHQDQPRGCTRWARAQAQELGQGLELLTGHRTVLTTAGSLRSSRRCLS